MGTISQLDHELQMRVALSALNREKRLLDTLLLDCMEPLHGVIRCRHCFAFIEAVNYEQVGIAHEPGCVVGQIIQERS